MVAVEFEAQVVAAGWPLMAHQLMTIARAS